jgi:hypothetical protein
MLCESILVYKKGLTYNTNTCKPHKYKLSLKTVSAGLKVVYGTISLQAVVHPWLAADAHGNKQ